VATDKQGKAAMHNLFRAALVPLSFCFALSAQAQHPGVPPASTPTSTPASAPSSAPTSAPALPPASYPSKPTFSPEELPAPPKGIVDVYTILGTNGLRFVPNLPVEAALFEAGAQSNEPEETLHAVSDSKGLARFAFTKYAPGKIIKAYTEYKGVAFESDPFELSDKTGSANLIGVFDVSNNGGQITLGSGSFLMVSFDEGIMTFLMRMIIENRSDTAFMSASGNFPIPLPKGAFGAQSADSPYYETQITGENQSEIAFNTKTKPILPGQMQVLVQFHMSPPEESSLDFDMTLPFPATMFGVQAQNDPPIGDVVVEGMPVATEVIAPKGEIQKFKGTKGPLLNKSFSVSLTGLPYGKGFENTLIYGAIFAFIAFALFLFLTVPKNEDLDPKKSKIDPQQAERERLYRELVTLEQGKQQGKVTPERYQKQREDKLKRLVTLTRLNT
jgi:hypothetical protein